MRRIIMSSKTEDKKVLNKTARRVGVSGRGKKDVTLQEQYKIIRDDLMRLRNDLAKGYNMTRAWIDKRGSMRGMTLRAK